MKTLHQTRGFNSKTFTIEKNRVCIETKSFSKATKVYVKLEKLGFELQYVKKNYYPKKILLAAIWFLPIVLTILLLLDTPNIAEEGVFAFYFIALIVSFVSATDSYQDDIYLTGGESALLFYRNRPNESDVLAFIDEVISSTKAFLKAKYTDFDEATTAQDFYNCINWLYNREIITREEYINYKASFDMQKLLS
jgi:hypothetical protein